MPINLFFHIKNYLLKKTEDITFNAWGYIKFTSEKEKERFQGEESRNQSDEHKACLQATWEKLKNLSSIYEIEKDSCKEPF